MDVIWIQPQNSDAFSSIVEYKKANGFSFELQGVEATLSALAGTNDSGSCILQSNNVKCCKFDGMPRCNDAKCTITRHQQFDNASENFSEIFHMAHTGHLHVHI